MESVLCMQVDCTLNGEAATGECFSPVFRQPRENAAEKKNSSLFRNGTFAPRIHCFRADRHCKSGCLYAHFFFHSHFGCFSLGSLLSVSLPPLLSPRNSNNTNNNIHANEYSSLISIRIYSYCRYFMLSFFRHFVRCPFMRHSPPPSLRSLLHVSLTYFCSVDDIRLTRNFDIIVFDFHSAEQFLVRSPTLFDR